ncbi:hypothetical protein [Methylocapsa aurea]|uniref:hypothetical protein n=1 Tax=Methylocapsa aurea TaxID=663610 RepID=UPI0012EB5492|nr:hypothetical protein [Methylocapsa aurea]
MVDENWARFERERERQRRDQAFRENAERAAREQQRAHRERTEAARKQYLEWSDTEAKLTRNLKQQKQEQQRLSDNLSRQIQEKRQNKQKDYLPIDTRSAGSSWNFGWLTILVGVVGLFYMLRNASQSTINIVIGCGIIFAVVVAVKWIVTWHPRFVLCVIIAGIWYYNTH